LLARFDIKMLPLFIAISAVTSLPVILVAGRLMVRWGPARLIPVVNVVSAALAVVEWLLLQRYPRFGAVMAYFHFSIAGAVLVSGFWSIVNERFDVRSAKRHIGRIGMGATLGGILGGLIAERTVEDVKKVPLLGEIPLLGPLLFSSTYKKKELTNVLFFIRPRILQGSDLHTEF